MKIVLQKLIADSGYCSRRKAEELIRSGKVKVDGKIAELGTFVETRLIASLQSEVRVDGKKIDFAKNDIYIKLNKPVGYACTNAKVKGEKNVFDLVNTKERLFIVGRLDKNSRGLVLLTNDGELTQRITHPKFEHEKIYRVQIKKLEAGSGKAEVDKIIKQFKKGIDIGEGDGTVKAKNIQLCHSCESRNPGKNSLSFEIILTYGKKRQIRRMFKKLGFEVIDLLRTEIAGLKLGNLKEGKWERLKDAEIKKLK